MADQSSVTADEVPAEAPVANPPEKMRVRVDRTRVAGMRDFLVVPHWHPMLLVRRRVADQTVHFLECGGFRR